jgi:hypothetical protein
VEVLVSGLSNTQRTLRALKQQGYISGIVEKFNPYVGEHGKRIDLFNFIDIISIKPIGICAIQSCGSNFSEHDRRILENEYAPEWLKAGGHIELWGWRKIKKKRGGKQMIWKPRVKIYTMDDYI